MLYEEHEDCIVRPNGEVQPTAYNLTATEVREREIDYNKLTKSLVDGIDMDKMIKIMEEMANTPEEKMGERQPGERGMYERIT